MRVAMIGTGYVGLVSGACFADFGHEVICVDKDTGKIAALEKGEVPIYEPGLNDLVAANRRAGRLKFTNDLPGAVKAADAVFIAVGTPSRRGDGHADLTFVYDAARERGNLSGVLVDTGHVVAEIGKAGPGNEADTAGADHGNAHIRAFSD